MAGRTSAMSASRLSLVLPNCFSSSSTAFLHRVRMALIWSWAVTFSTPLAPFSRGKAMAHRAASSQLLSAAWAKACRSSQVAARLSP